MPRVVVHTQAPAHHRCAALLLGGSLYQTTVVPYLDVEKDDEVSASRPDMIKVDNITSLTQSKEVENVYVHEEEEEEITLSVRRSPTTESVCTKEDERTDIEARASPVPVPVPNMESEVANLFGRSRVMPPPPPSHVKTTAPLRFWYNRLMADDALYRSCNVLAGFALTAFPSVEAETREITREVSDWASEAGRWWVALANTMSTNGLGCNVPLHMRWNPYCVVLIRRYMPLYATTAEMVSSTAEVTPFSRLPPPHPPTYAVLRDEQMQDFDAERLAQKRTKVWWRAATAWAAAVAATPADRWICPPPTTAESTEAWVKACNQWCAYVRKQLKATVIAEKRRRTR